MCIRDRGIARKLSTDEEGNPIIREETGTYIYQDTNNSTDDFERGVVPVTAAFGIVHREAEVFQIVP